MFGSESIENVLNTLTYCLSQPLPGIRAQAQMAPEGRLSGKYDPNPQGARISSVMILMLPAANDFRITFIRRVSNGSVHSGQLAFPGGKAEDFDLSIVHTALRECTEEIGINSSDVRILGQLTKVYIPVSNFTVHPIVGFMAYQPTYLPSLEEVDEIHEIELSQLCHPANRTKRSMKIRGEEIEVPVFKIGHLEIWGATAMILSEFIEVISYLKMK